MLLYHFPLISDYSNRGYAKLYNANGNEKPLASLTTGFVSGGKISSNAKGTTTTLGVSYWDKRYNSYSIAIRAYRGNDANNIYGHLIVLHGGSTGKTDLNARFLNGNLKIGYYVIQSQVVITEIDVPATIGWHDIVMNFNSGTLKCYLDTNFIGSIDSISYDIVPYFFGNNFIGSNISTTTLIQDVRIYDRELSQAEINEYSRALVVHYPLQGNELNTSVLKDVSGFGNDFEFPYLNYYGESVRGEKIAATKSSAWLQNSSRLYNTAKVVRAKTISFWAKRTSATVTTGGTGDLASLYVAKQNGTSTSEYIVYIGLLKTGNIIRLQSQSSYVINLTTSYRFYTYVYTDDAKFLIYVNGERVKEFINTVSYKDIYAGFCSYGWAAGVNVEDAVSLVDYRVYATALSAEDIKNLYNSPIAVSKQHQTMAFEFKENPLYQSKYWRTPTYAEMNYILNTRTNAANLRTFGRVEISSGIYRNGLFLLPDEFVAPSGIIMIITTANFIANSYTLSEFVMLENLGVVFLPISLCRSGSSIMPSSSELDGSYLLGSQSTYGGGYCFFLKIYPNKLFSDNRFFQKNRGASVRLCQSGTHFSTSATTKIDFAPANLQYHCTQHIWRFAEHSYDYIGAANANISDTYNGWIDLFGYGTSGVNYSPTLHTTNNSDYASGGIANTDNDWGINEIQSYNYNVKNFAANKNGIVQHNELRENDSDVNGCYQDKLITNKLIEQ